MEIPEFGLNAVVSLPYINSSNCLAAADASDLVGDNETPQIVAESHEQLPAQRCRDSGANGNHYNPICRTTRKVKKRKYLKRIGVPKSRNVTPLAPFSRRTDIRNTQLNEESCGIEARNSGSFPSSSPENLVAVLPRSPHLYSEHRSTSRRMYDSPEVRTPRRTHTGNSASFASTASNYFQCDAAESERQDVQHFPALGTWQTVTYVHDGHRGRTYPILSGMQQASVYTTIDTAHNQAAPSQWSRNMSWNEVEPSQVAMNTSWNEEHIQSTNRRYSNAEEDFRSSNSAAHSELADQEPAYFPAAEAPVQRPVLYRVTDVSGFTFLTSKPPTSMDMGFIVSCYPITPN